MKLKATTDGKPLGKSVAELFQQVIHNALGEMVQVDDQGGLTGFLNKIGQDFDKAKAEALKLTKEQAEQQIKEIIDGVTLEQYKAAIKTGAWPWNDKPDRAGYTAFLNDYIRSINFVVLIGTHNIQRKKVAAWLRANIDKAYPPPPGYTYTPPQNINSPNDKVIHEMKKAKDEAWGQGFLEVVEQNKTRKTPKIVSKVTYNLEVMKKLDITRLEPFDWNVFQACISIQSAGNTATTINSVYRLMTGKHGDEAPSKDLARDIMKSLVILLSLPVTVDARGICEYYGKDVGAGQAVGVLLPARIEKAMINGTETDRAIVFLDDSPLVKIAKDKGGQFITYPAELLNVPINANKQTIPLAPYLLNAIEDSRSGKVQKIILIDSVIQGIGYGVQTGHRGRLASMIESCFTYWKNCKYIKSFTIEKDGRGKAIRVKYTLPRKKTEEIAE